MDNNTRNNSQNDNYNAPNYYDTNSNNYWEYGGGPYSYNDPVSQNINNKPSFTYASANNNYEPQQNYYNTDPANNTSEQNNKKKKKGGRSTFRQIACILAAIILTAGISSGVTVFTMNIMMGDIPANSTVLAGNSSDSADNSTNGNNTKNSDSILQIAPTSNTETSSSISTIVEKAAPSVVEITTEMATQNPFIGQYITSGAGSGVIVSSDGYIVTNNHVIDSATSITVRTSDGEEYSATLVGTDSQTDLAVIKIDAANLTPATVSDSDKISVGDLAVAIGNPLGEFGGTVTDGIISAKDRDITIDGQTMTLLQTSAAVNPGNSGGGLFNSSGNLVGIVNAKSSGSDIEGLAFAIPSNTMVNIVDEIIDNGYVTGRVQIGIQIVDVADLATASMYGVSEPGVYVASSSLENGLQAGDLIISINGKDIKSSSDISDLIENKSVGDKITLVIKRNGKEQQVAVTLYEQVPENTSTVA